MFYLISLSIYKDIANTIDSYEVDGEKRSSQKIVADRVTFLSSRPKPEPEPAL